MCGIEKGRLKVCTLDELMVLCCEEKRGLEDVMFTCLA